MELNVAIDLDRCPSCNSEVTASATTCNVCEDPIGFPNVRLALKEKKALKERYDLELASIKVRGLLEITNTFETAVQNAKVVMGRSVLQFVSLIDGDNALLNTYYQQVASSSRVAENNMFDPKRPTVESISHPHYYESIHYAALSLNGKGTLGYGGAHIVFKSEYIEKRTTFFEENPFLLLTKLKLIASESLPEGYRSTWEDKGKLAVCKLHSKITDDTNTIEEFQDILLGSASGDFIEANIYGKIHKAIFKEVSFISHNTTDKALIKAYTKKIRNAGITINE
jgi:hypothetical protein